MDFNVYRLSKNNKIFRSIIGFYTVNMVNNLIRLKSSSNLFFSDKSMFFNVVVWFHRVRMISIKNKNIPVFVNNPTTPPSMTIYTKLSIATGARTRAIHQMFMTCYKNLTTVKTCFFIINLSPSRPNSGPVPNTFSRIFPNVFNLGYFHI